MKVYSINRMNVVWLKATFMSPERLNTFNQFSQYYFDAQKPLVTRKMWRIFWLLIGVLDFFISRCEFEADRVPHKESFCNNDSWYLDAAEMYDTVFNFLSLFHPDLCSYIIMPIFTLIVSSTVGGKLHLLVKQRSQRWEVMGRNTENSTHAGLVSRELSFSFRDGALLSFKKGSAWLVCYYWSTDVRVSVTCLVKRKEWRQGRERGVCYVTNHQWLIIISMREISRHTEGLSKPPTLLFFLLFLLLVFCLFAAWEILFSVSFASSTPFFLFLQYFLLLFYFSHFLIFYFKFQVSSTSLPLLVFLQPAWGLAFYALTCIIAGQSREISTDSKEIIISGGKALGSRLYS